MLLEVFSACLLTLAALVLARHRCSSLSSHMKTKYHALVNKRFQKRSLKTDNVYFPSKPESKQNISKKSHADQGIQTGTSKIKRKKYTSMIPDDGLKTKKPQEKIDSLPQKNARISAGKLKKLNEAARKRKLLSTEEIPGPFTFVVDHYGGVVETPFCNIIFPYGAVSRTMGIIMNVKYQNEDTTGDREHFIMTPEIFFKSKNEMKFLQPVEVHMQTHYQATNRRKHIPVQIERTERRAPVNWMKYAEVEFHKGMIMFVCNQFCGYRARCDLCQLDFISTRLCYCLSVQDTASPPASRKEVYLRVFSDTPRKIEEINHEMREDGHRRIHPTQTYTVRTRRNLMIRLTGEGLKCSPLYHIAEVDTTILSRAFLFNLSQPTTSSSWEFNADIAEISPFQKTKIRFDSNASVPNESSSAMRITVNDRGIGVQYNINMPENGQISGRHPSAEERRGTHEYVQPPPNSSQQSLPSISEDHNVIIGSAGTTLAHTKPMETWLTENPPSNSPLFSSSEFVDGTARSSAETKPMKTWLTRPLTSRCNSAASFSSQSSETGTIVPSSYREEQDCKTTYVKNLTSRCNSAISFSSQSSDTGTVLLPSSSKEEQECKIVDQKQHTSAFHRYGRSETSHLPLSLLSVSQVHTTGAGNGKLDHNNVDGNGLQNEASSESKDNNPSEINKTNVSSKDMSQGLVSIKEMLLKNGVEQFDQQENAESEFSFTESGFDSADGIYSRNMSAMSADCGFYPIHSERLDKSDIQAEELDASDYVQEKDQQLPEKSENECSTSDKKSYSDAVKATKERINRRGVSSTACTSSDIERRRPRWRC